MNLVPVADDLVNRLISASRNEQKSFDAYIREVLASSLLSSKDQMDLGKPPSFKRPRAKPKSLQISNPFEEEA